MYIQIVIQLLVDNIVPVCYNENQQGGEQLNDQEIEICGHKFQGKQQIINHIKTILNSNAALNLNEVKELTGEEEKFMIEIFKGHPNGHHKMMNFKGIGVGK